MKKFFLPLWLASFLAQAAWASPASTHIQWSSAATGGDRGSIKVTYRLDGSDNGFLEKDDREASLRERFMHRDGGCFAISKAKLEREGTADCHEAAFAIRPDIAIQDRLYAFAEPIGNDGVLLYGPYLALRTTDTTTHWVLRAPIVVVDGRVYTRQAEISFSSADPPGYIYLGSEKPQAWNGVSVVLDRRVPQWLGERIRKDITALQRVLSAGLGESLPKPLALVVSLDAAYGEAPFFHGDVARRSTIRLSFYGHGAEQDNGVNKGTADAFLAHEMVHLYQPRSDGNEAWTAEGNAEFLSIIALVRAGLITTVEATHRLEDHVNECAIIAGAMRWADVDKRSGRVPYACGSALHLFGALSAVHGGDALAAWRGMNDRFGQLDTKSFAMAYPSLLLPADKPLVEFMRTLGQSQGWREVATSSSDAIASMLFKPIMDEDCDGAYGFWSTADGLVLDVQPSCKQFATKRTIRTVAGVDLIHASLEAAKATYSACKATGKVAVGATDGTVLNVACSHPYEPPASLFELDGAGLKALYGP